MGRWTTNTHRDWWEEYMHMERTQLAERASGKTRHRKGAKWGVQGGTGAYGRQGRAPGAHWACQAQGWGEEDLLLQAYRRPHARGPVAEDMGRARPDKMAERTHRGREDSGPLARE